tara:strand:+ start:175 stop:375 length:201 start_codon:yes stop_codon:yes gene_type:complete
MLPYFVYAHLGFHILFYYRSNNPDGQADIILLIFEDRWNPLPSVSKSKPQIHPHVDRVEHIKNKKS